MKKLRKNNKGFSLVELIVVMAIMAILAVTLTPRLTQYIDKARQSNDREIPNAVFTAVKLALLDDTIRTDIAATNGTGNPTYDWSAAPGVDILDIFYNRVMSGDPARGTDEYNRVSTPAATDAPDMLANEIIATLGDSIRFQSNLADDHAARIFVRITDAAAGEFSVSFSYEGTNVAAYTMSTADLR